MKRLFILLTIVLLGGALHGQDGSGKLYVIMEMMRVDNEQETAYADTENFWEKIHQQRVLSGEITGWDLWTLLPGGEDQNYQYMTVTLFDDLTKMFSAMDLMANAKKAYPDMSEADLTEKLNSTAKSRDLAVRIFMEVIATTRDNFQLAPGSVAIINLMKVDQNNYAAYEKAETEVFQPIHQKEVDAGTRGSWALARFLLPYGSATYASHIAVDLYKDMAQALQSIGNEGAGEYTAAQQQAFKDGLATRDLKFINMGILMKMVR